jgi:transcription elongation GreA/GreB family factor
MSRAFVKETAESAPPPERMVSDGPNLVTAAGLRAIEAEVARLEDALKNNPESLVKETLERDLRYWRHAKASAQVVAPSADDAVAFGSRVTLKRAGREQTFQIVGEDEADPARGLLNFRSPLAAALIGARVGDVLEAAAPLGEIAILKIEN